MNKRFGAADTEHQQQELSGNGKARTTCLHQILFRFSSDDYREIGRIWQGEHPEDGSPRRVEDGPPQGFAPPNLPEEPQLTAPLGPEMHPDF